MKKLAFFGDVGGHFMQFHAALEKLGVDTDKGVVPEDLIVCQVGDLVHKGPNSRGTVALVDKLLKRSPDNYVQLLGNHEGQYVGGPVFWDQFMDSETTNTIERWYENQQANLAAAFYTDEYGPLMATHAGMTVQFWNKYVHKTDVVGAANVINNLPTEIQFIPGYMLGGTPVWEGGPAWAHMSLELYLPWDLAPIDPPFSQLHGHTSVVWWDRKRWSQDMQTFADRCDVDVEKRHSVLTIRDKKFIGCDPGYGRRATQVQMYPLILHGELLE